MSIFSSVKFVTEDLNQNQIEKLLSKHTRHLVPEELHRQAPVVLAAAEHLPRVLQDAEGARGRRERDDVPQLRLLGVLAVHQRQRVADVNLPYTHRNVCARYSFYQWYAHVNPKGSAFK